MTKVVTLLIICLGLVFVLACDPAPPISVQNASTPAPTAKPAPGEPGHIDPDHPMIEAPRISLADAKKDYDAKAAVFVDTHSTSQFEMEHINGAINIPANELNKYFDKIPKGKKLIVYCS